MRENDRIYIKDAVDNIGISVNNGELGAILNSFNNIVPKNLSSFDTFATTFADSVNSIHRTGYSLTVPPSTNIKFFNDYQPGSFTINKDILSNMNLIAASIDGADGNNEIAVKISELKNGKVIENKTLLEYYSEIVTNFAAEKNLNSQNHESFKLIVDELESQKASVSGVSIDEEMTNVIKYQRAYDASAKLIRVADELMTTLLQVV